MHQNDHLSVGFIQEISEMAQYTKISNPPNKQTEEKKKPHTIISLDIEKAFDKTQHP